MKNLQVHVWRESLIYTLNEVTSIPNIFLWELSAPYPVQDYVTVSNKKVMSVFRAKR